MFTGKSVLVTGGTGSFGRALVAAALRDHAPRRLVIFSRDELKQFEMQQEFSPEKYGCLRYFLGDVRDLPRLTQAMRNVDLVIHAAALKQVPAAEKDPMECIKTNIHGAENVITAALDCGVAQVVALSTDKAVNPINLYGATKLAADKLFVAANNLAGRQPTRFSVVRYANVAGSRGSVAPFFRKLVESGAKEIPVTDAEMTRFWISVEQGVDLVERSFSRMRGGEIFVPKIPSIRIVDLAAAIAPGLPTRVVGIRPGEKLHETLCPSDDSHLTLEFSDHFVIQPTISHLGVDYRQNAVNETGKPVVRGFEYTSRNNPDFMSVAQLRKLHA